MIARMKGILGVYSCSGCNRSHTFSEKLPTEKVRRFLCPHFNFVLNIMKIPPRYKMQIRSSCNFCYKEYSSELKIGGKKFMNGNEYITDDNYTSSCCGYKIDIAISFSEEYFDQNEPSDIHNDINVNSIHRRSNSNSGIRINNNNNNNFRNNLFRSVNPMMTNSMSINMNLMNNMSQLPMNNNNLMNNMNFNNMNMQINNNINIMDYVNKFDSANIIKFSHKNKLVNFADEESNKNYKIYTSPQLRLQTVLNDLLNLYPEINYSNNNLMLNQIILSLNSTIESLNLNNNSVILIKNKQIY